jgi:hypothetical protein
MPGSDNHSNPRKDHNMTTNPQDVIHHTLRDLFDEIKNSHEFEDRREYQPEDLQRMYGLSLLEAGDLYYLIQREFDPTIQQNPSLDNIPAEVFKEYFLEAQHSNWDGWDDEHDRLTLDRVLDDLILYSQV